MRGEERNKREDRHKEHKKYTAVNKLAKRREVNEKQ